MSLLLSNLMTLGASLTAGSHTLGGRNFFVVLPTGGSKYPVMIALHGNGGKGEPAARSVANGNSNIASTHIVIGPDGPSNSWNIKGETSKEDDQLYIGKTLLDHLATFDNVDASSFKLYGFSNGAALTNRILIENDDARITHAITDGSQLNTFQYRPNNNGAFYVGGPSNAYTTVKASLKSRRVLQMVGGDDKLIPAAGGQSGIGDGDGGKLQMVPWEDSALAYAVSFGASGGKASLSPDSADQAKASYLSGQVVAYNFKAVGHVAGPSNALAKAAVDAFLAIAGGAAAPSGPSSSAPSAPSSAPSGPACSGSCATEFDKCVAFGTNSYASCRAEIEAGTGPLKKQGCVAGCADTTSMAAHNTNPTSGSAASGLSGGALAAIIAGAAAAVTGAALAYYWLRVRGRSGQPAPAKEMKPMDPI